MCAVPTLQRGCAYAPAWLQRAGLGTDGMGTGVTQRGSEGGGRSCWLSSPEL
jgi:hypothetical protein